VFDEIQSRFAARFAASLVTQDQSLCVNILLPQ
jgi:hypothetical protein